MIYVDQIYMVSKSATRVALSQEKSLRRDNLTVYPSRTWGKRSLRKDYSIVIRDTPQNISTILSAFYGLLSGQLLLSGYDKDRWQGYYVLYKI